MTTITTQVHISSAGKYSYIPDSVTVTEPNTTLVYELDGKTAESWEIVGLTTTDSKNQISDETKSPSGNSISVLDANSQQETFDVTVVAQHRVQRDRILRIDPVVRNEPQ